MWVPSKALWLTTLVYTSVALGRDESHPANRRIVAEGATFNIPDQDDGIGSDEGKSPFIVKYKNSRGSGTVMAMSLEVNVNIKSKGILGANMTNETAEILRLNEDVEAVEPDGKVFALHEGPAGNLRRNMQENEPFGVPMVLQDVNFWNALDPPSGSIKVCVADTGYDLGHVDLPQTYVTGTSTAEPGYANDQWDVDKHGHGTHCSGTVAAIGGNSEGVVGVIPDNKDGQFGLVIGNALTGSGSGTWTGVMEAVANCIKDGAKVVSLSLGGSSQSTIMKDFFEDYYENDDILFVAAAGNGASSSYSFPASYPSLMSVAAIDENKDKAYFSQYNDQVEISGPGVGVTSSTPNDQYETWSGTSMATPHVAAVAGLLWMHFPECKNYQIRNAILATAEDLGSAECDTSYGHGLVRAKSAYDLLKKGNCGGNLGATDGKVGGCAQLSPTENPAPTSTEYPKTFSPTTTQTIVFPPTSTEDPKTFAPTTTETIVFPPTSTEVPESFPPTSTEVPESFPPTTTQTLVFPPTGTEVPESLSPTTEESLSPTTTQTVVIPPTGSEDPKTFSPTATQTMQFPPTSTEVPDTMSPTTTQTLAFPPTGTEEPETASPTSAPTPLPTKAPTLHPTVTPPTPFPTNSPPTPFPTNSPPTPHPTISPPTSHPTNSPPTSHPTNSPPTSHPTNSPPTPHPTNSPPTSHPTNSPPTPHPTQKQPTFYPTQTPPTSHPTQSPPTPHPTQKQPTFYPTQTPPTSHPTQSPTTLHPTVTPPTPYPTQTPPTSYPTQTPPTPFPTKKPTLAQVDKSSSSSSPTKFPTKSPTLAPTHFPSFSPTTPPKTCVELGGSCNVRKNRICCTNNCIKKKCIAECKPKSEQCSKNYECCSRKCKKNKCK